MYYFSTLSGEKTISRGLDSFVVNISELRNPLAVSPELENITASLASLSFTQMGARKNNKDCYERFQTNFYLMKGMGFSNQITNSKLLNQAECYIYSKNHYVILSEVL